MNRAIVVEHMKFIASFKDGVIASVEGVNTSFTYSNLIEGRLSGATRYHMARIKERMAQIEAGILKGFYCFEPDFMDEKEYYGDIELPFKTGKCLKDNQVSVHLLISEHCGQSSITLEWYSSTKELSEKPLTEIVQEHVDKLKFSDINWYCKYNDWDDLV